MTLMFENRAQNKIMNYKMHLKEITEKALGVPEQNYQACIKMDTNAFSKTIKVLSTLGDTCSISYMKKAVKFSADDVIVLVNITVRRSEPSIDVERKGTTMTISEAGKLSFLLKDLSFFTKATSLSTRVNSCRARDAPLLAEILDRPNR